MTRFTVGFPLVLLASSASAQVALQPSRFFFPKDGQPNNNGYVGPFCCTGRTAVVRTVDGYPVAYVYFHEFPGGGIVVGGASFATTLTLPISAAIDPSNPNSPHQLGKITFRADEMRFKLSRSATVGGFSFTAWLGKAPRRFLDGQWRYALGTVGVWLQVSSLPAADQGLETNPPPEGGENLPAVEDTTDVPPDLQTFEEPAPQEDHGTALARGLAGIIRGKLLQKKPDPAACSGRPDRGPYRAAKERSYYDPASGRCQTFTWGGCQGVVPFDSLKACMAACEGR